MALTRCASLLGASVLILTAVVATGGKAETITNYVNLPTPQADSTSVFSGAPFPSFNPALGTLNSVSVNISGMVTFGDFFYLFYKNVNGTAFEFNFDDDAEFSFLLPGAFLVNFTDASSMTISEFEAGGDITLRDFNQFFFSPGVATFSPASTVVYDYTPAAATVPEPAAFAVLLAGVLGSLASRRLLSR